MREIVGSLLAGIAVELFFNVFGTADRMRLVNEVLWAWGPAIGLGMACAAFAALAPTILKGVRSSFRWVVDSLPSNRFLADAYSFQDLYRQWTSYETAIYHDPAELVVLRSDSLTLCEKHDISCPGTNETTDGLWRTLLLNLIAASRRGDLKKARGLLAAIKSQPMEVEPRGVGQRIGL